MKTDILIFIGDKQINKIMGAFDMNDSNTQMFGKFQNLKITHTKEFTHEKFNKLIKQFQTEFNLGFILSGDFSWINQQYMSFSDGHKWFSRFQLKEKIKAGEKWELKD